MNRRNALMRGMGRPTALTLLCVLGSFGVAMPVRATTTVTQITYDAGDHIVSVTDPRQLVTTYTYDGLGQLWQQVSPDTGTTTYNYDSYGRPSSMTRADNTLTNYGYDGLNRIASVSAGGQTQTFTYDTCTHGVGRLCSAADATGTTSYSYSPEGWLTGRGFSISGTTYSLGYGYNSLGEIASVVYPDGNQALYSYTQGVVSGITLNVGGTNVTGASAVTYQPMNAGMSSWTSSNGVVNTLNYDTDGRLTGIGAGSVQSLGFGYDVANRIIAVTNGIDGSMNQNFGYDDESRLLSLYSGADIESYQYDLNGNRTSQVVNGTSTPSTVSTTSNQLASFGAQSYGYDAKGNTTTVAGTATYHFDAFNRMDSAAGMAYYVNPEGQRLRKSGAAGTSYFAPDRNGPMLAEYSGGAWIDYVWLNGRLIGRVAGGQRFAIHDDQTGRPEAVTNGSGAVVWRAQNFAFTQNVTTAGFALNLGFPGQYYDAETSAWNNGFRDYKSALGRYLESDPVGLAGGINTYAYVGNNPLSFTDSLGLNPGDPFTTPGAAAVDALNYLRGPTAANSTEYAGLIYQVGNSYYATIPVQGDYDSSTPFNSQAEQEVRNAVGMPVGDYHTHPYIHLVNGKPTPGNEQNTNFKTNCFSDTDIAFSNSAAKIFNPFTAYLGTPVGILTYTPSTGAFGQLNY